MKQKTVELNIGEGKEQLNLKEARAYLGLTRYSLEPTLRAHGIHISDPINQRGRYVLKKDLDQLKKILEAEMTK